MAEEKNLAFILPVYRGKDLHRTLHSLAAQTDRGFTVYLSDDACPGDPSALASEFEDAFDLRCTRFGESLGEVSRSRHLERSLALAGREEFVCFLEEGTVLAPNCVSRLRKTVSRHPEYHVYHWNTELVKADGTLAEKVRRYGASLSVEGLFRKLFLKDYPAPLSSFVFRRETLLSRGVFDGTLYRTDFQNLFACAKDKGVRTVRWARIRERADRTDMPSAAERKTLSLLAFFRWSEPFFGDSYPLSVGDRLDLFAATASRLFPDYTDGEIKERFMSFAVCQGTFRKLKAASALRSALKARTAELKGKN